MTLAFSYDFGAGPWLVADTLISGTSHSRDFFPLPTGRIEKGAGTLDLAGFTSKIANYGDFSIAWAGRLEAACSALRHIQRHHKDNWWTESHLSQTLNDAAREDEVSFILHRLIQQSPFPRIERSAHGDHKRSGVGKELVLAIGSGSNSIHELLQELPRAPSRELVRRSLTFAAMRSAYIDYVETIAKLTSSEAYWWLERGCGGMYEACIPEIGDMLAGKLGYQRFHKLESVDLFYWDIKHANDIHIDIKQPNKGTWKVDLKMAPGDVCMTALPNQWCSIGYMDNLGIIEQRDVGPFLDDHLVYRVVNP